ncbi:AbrB/MazE/SpoVT family DNA-binding domain-containing protein [uncultured Intestinimonas sp.]|uniref:AbrB/MazE/SpoVT family DNA-binding domain-containing protein n=1 Tax=uncultured Intestinimonas sp. TaxID=1689265 RepID=UPI0025EE60C8|nr:AbrB/MazE/SpoVT family DNA-binding domain-containing protein [uncultured Intestinimonas sp.]
MSESQYMSSVKVGPKGQIVIPKEVREMFGIRPGDTLLILADSTRGIALERYEVFEKIANAIFQGRGRELYPDYSEEESRNFAQGVLDLKAPPEEQP